MSDDAASPGGFREEPALGGVCDPRFAAVRAAFEANFREERDVGAAVAVTLEGRPVVDLWGGLADPVSGRAWQADTLVGVASVTKGITTLAALHLMERGLLKIDAPVARYWPEFARMGKEAVTVRHLLNHRAGLPAVGPDLPAEALFDWGAFIGGLEDTAPAWPPGSRHGYHPMTFGYLVGEVVRRITGISVGQYLRREITGPLDADFFVGLPYAAESRVARLLPDRPPPAGQATMWTLILRNPDPLARRAFLNPPRIPGGMNSRAFRAAEIPAANGITTARALARIYGALARPDAPGSAPLLATETLARATRQESYGPDAILPYTTCFGLGFMLSRPMPAADYGVGIDPFGPGPRAFGHPGRGGALAFADPDAGLGFGYVMNQLVSGTRERPDTRAVRLIAALYQALGAGG